MLVSLVKALMPAFGQMWSECKRYGPGLQIEINKLNLDNQIMGNKASALKMYELIAAWQDPILTCCHYFPLASVLFHQYAGSCTSPPSLPSAITFQFQTGWTKQFYLSAQMVTLLMWDYEVQVAGTRGRGGGGNRHRLMHNECPYYANEWQQPLSYVPQNKLWFRLMAKFCMS